MFLEDHRMVVGQGEGQQEDEAGRTLQELPPHNSIFPYGKGQISLTSDAFHFGGQTPSGASDAIFTSETTFH